MKQHFKITFIFLLLISCKKIKFETIPEKPNFVKSLVELTLPDLKTYINGEWNLYYTRQMFDTTLTRIYNNKINFNQNVDSIKWVDNNTIKINDKLIFTYDTAHTVLTTTNKINFSNMTTNFVWVASNYDGNTKYLTLIDNNTRKMYFLYK